MDCNCVALSADSQFALAGGSDGSVRIWNIISGDCAGICDCGGLRAMTIIANQSH